MGDDNYDDFDINADRASTCAGSCGPGSDCGSCSSVAPSC
jgi:hypothetical protein